ncbi:hypothetical protein DFH09DRAFT_1425633 [Mycena vulgaris]|nr:hypothetical protein DFH09DRAFT_1425633 [Mycena vulgaris]
MLLDAPVVPLLAHTLETPPRSPEPPYFVIAVAGNKGAGLFAARDIPAGALILVDRPLAIVPSNVRTREASDALLPRLSHSSRARLLALANCKSLVDHLVEGIALTNAIQIDLPVPPAAAPQEYGAIFPRVCRANHICGLNVAVKWDHPSFSVCMYALRAFRAGEEITNQCIDVLAPRAERHAQLERYASLMTPWPRATLRVPSCARSASCTRASPRGRRTCAARMTPSSPRPPALALIEQEGLHGLRVPFVEETALSYALLGDEVQLRTWAQEIVDLCEGQDPERAALFSGWIADPSTHKRWGWRVKGGCCWRS